MQAINWTGEPFTNRYVLAYGAAVLLHLLFFLFYGPLMQVLVVSPVSPASKPERPPMVFEFVDLPGQAPSERPPEETPLLSHRQSIGRDLLESPLPLSYLPYSEGIVEAKEDFQTRIGEEREGGAPEEAPEEQPLAWRNLDRALDAVTLLKERRLQTRQQREEAVYGPEVARLQMANRESSALERGDFQLSTYAWNFAPYMSYLKRRIGNHMFPPPAFKDYGLIDGKIRVRFKILRDGALKDLEVLEYEGSSLLRDTSTDAVRLSAAFRPLPDDFPDDYLEITGTFEYILIGDPHSP